MSGHMPIPKFASFRPKPVEEPPKAEITTETSRHEEQHKRHHHHHHHRRHRPRSKERSRDQPGVRKPTVASTIDDTVQIFVEDRLGDPKNLVYGSIHKYSVPPFHRIGSGCVLGAGTHLKIERNAGEDKEIILSDRLDEAIGKKKKYAFARNEEKPNRLLRIRPEAVDNVKMPDNLDFIALSISRPRKKTRLGSHSSESSDEDRQNYRSIEGKAKAPSNPLDGALEYVTESDSSDPEYGRRIRFDDHVRRKNIELSRRVDEHPENVDAWIDLISHQDKLLGHEDDKKMTNAERRSTADIKIHLYEKALGKAGATLANRERLLVGLMAEGLKIWDAKTQLNKWEQISQENLDSLLLWKQYLDFRQSSILTFRYDEVRCIFVKRINLLKTKIEQGNRSEPESDGLYDHLIYTILRATLFMREAGYSEVAVAIWQALLELNFRGVPQTTASSSRIDAFQEFWESEVPRIGEDGARGWKNFDGKADIPDEKIDEKVPPGYLTSPDIFGSWAVVEKLKAAASREPARTLDDVTEDDPFRVILWADISDFMVDIPSASEGMSRLLLNAFLMFCRLPPIPAPGDRTFRQWWLDSFIQGLALDASQSWVDDHFMAHYAYHTQAYDLPVSSDVDEDRNTSIKSNIFDLLCQDFAGAEDTLFSTNSWATYFKPWHGIYDGEDGNGPIGYAWLRNALKDLVAVNPVQIFAEYYLAFMYCNEPQEIKNVAKGVVRRDPKNLRLYNAYAMIEWSRGNRGLAIGTLTTAMEMAFLPGNQHPDSIVLWRTWIWTYLEVRDNDEALKCIFCIADGMPKDLSTIDISSPATALKTKQHLLSKRDYYLSLGGMACATLYAECLALMEYLSSNSGNETFSQGQGDIASALKVFDSFSQAMATRGYSSGILHELFLQRAARLLYHHAQAGPFRPALLREYLAKYLTLFPQNTIFLSLYAWNESRLRIDDRVRTILRSVILTDTKDNIVSRLFAIRFEMKYGNVHSTHAAFENAVSSPATRSNPGLWRLYIHFCVRTTKYRMRAKDVFFRAMRACPWSKDLMMMAFVELKDLMTFEELNSVYKVMGEKELRIHVDIEDRLEE